MKVQGIFKMAPPRYLVVMLVHYWPPAICQNSFKCFYQFILQVFFFFFFFFRETSSPLQLQISPFILEWQHSLKTQVSNV